MIFVEAGIGLAIANSRRRFPRKINVLAADADICRSERGRISLTFLPSISDVALGRIIETRDQRTERGLAERPTADQRDEFASSYIER